MIRISLIVVVCILLFSCSLGNEGSRFMDWKFEKMEHNLVEVTQIDADQIVINRLRALHESSPYDAEYKKLKLDKVLLNEVNEHKYYVFDILYVDDMQVVFVINKRGEIVRNFILSGFEE